jgi:hypothetical protein
VRLVPASTRSRSVLGSAIQYQIAEVVGPLVHVVAKIDKKAPAGPQP